METLEGTLPGVCAYICETLAKEKLSVAAEQQRQRFVEQLDILKLRKAPRAPALPPASAGFRAPALPTSAVPRAPAVLSAGLEQQNQVPAGRSNQQQPANSLPAENVLRAAADINNENVYNEVEDGKHYCAPLSSKCETDSSAEEFEGYEEPVNWKPLLRGSAQGFAAADVADAGPGDDLGTDYEEYSGDEEEEDEYSGQLAVDGLVGAETIQLPRVKSRHKKKKGLPDGWCKPYDALAVRQIEGEMYVRRNISWNRLHCVLSQNALYCYKTLGNMQPRVFVALNGYDVLLIDKEKGRSNVLRVSRPGSETLFLSCDSMEWANEWFKCMTSAAAVSENKSQGEDKGSVSPNFYCAQNTIGMPEVPPARRYSTLPAQERASDDGDYRPSSSVATASTATLPKSAPCTSGVPVSELASSPRAAPRKAVAPDNKKKGKITKLFGGTFGKKKGRYTMTMDLSSENAWHSTASDTVISGVLAVSSRHFDSNDWEEARCVIHSSGLFECYCNGSFDRTENEAQSVPSTANVSLSLMDCTVEQSNDKERPLAMRLLKGGNLELTIMPSDRLDHGNWLAALFKHVGRGSAASSRVVSSSTTGGSFSSGSSSGGSGDGIIQIRNDVNVGTACGRPVTDECDGTLQPSVEAGKVKCSDCLHPVYINVISDADISAVVSPLTCHGECDEYQDVSTASKTLQANHEGDSKTTFSASAASKPAAGDVKKIDLLSSGSKIIDSNLDKKQSSVAVPAEEESLNMVVRTHQAENVAKNKDTIASGMVHTPPVGQTSVTGPDQAQTNSQKADKLLIPSASHSNQRPISDAQKAGSVPLPAALKSSSTSGGAFLGDKPQLRVATPEVTAPFSSCSSATSNAADGVVAGDVQHATMLLGGVTPKKLAVSSGIARNRAMFEIGSTSISGGSGMPAAAVESRWTGYKLAVAPAVAGPSSALGSGTGRRRSSDCDSGSGASCSSNPVLPHASQSNISKPPAALTVDASFLSPHSVPPCDSSGGHARPVSLQRGKSTATHDLDAYHSKSSSLSSDSSISDGRPAAADGSSTFGQTRKAEARMFMGSSVGKPASSSAECRQQQLPAAATADGRLDSGEDVSVKQGLEKLRQQLAEFRKDRNHVRTQKTVASAQERVRLEAEYKKLDDKCRELERLISDLEDVNLMRIKSIRN